MTNFFNSTVGPLGAVFTAKNPNYQNQLGYDSDLMAANGVLPNGATATTMRLSTNGDTYYPAALTFTTDLYAPVLEGNSFAKTVVDVDGGATLPGDQLEYTLTLRNTGNDSATQTVVRDTLPANLNFVAGSLSVLSGPNAGAKTDAAADDQAEYVAASRSIVARLGAGATSAVGGTLAPGAQTRVRFRVRVAVPTASGTVVANQAAAAFLAAQLGTALSTRSDGDTLASGYQPTMTTVTASRITGTVFEDVNYGGGAGRSLAASAGVGRPGARVELYDAAGAYLSATTTNAAGLLHARRLGGGHVHRARREHDRGLVAPGRGGDAHPGADLADRGARRHARRRSRPRGRRGSVPAGRGGEHHVADARGAHHGRRDAALGGAGRAGRERRDGNRLRLQLRRGHQRAGVGPGLGAAVPGQRERAGQRGPRPGRQARGRRGVDLHGAGTGGATGPARGARQLR